MQDASKYRTPRQRKLELLRAYIDGTQYKGRKHWLDQSDPSPPLLERAPCIVYPIAENAIRSHCEMLFGDGRAPKIEDDELHLCEPYELSRLTADALASGECFALLGVSDELGFTVDRIDPAQVYNVEKTATGQVTSLEIRYPFVECAQDASGEWQEKLKLFRRVIDSKSDVTFFVADAPPSPASPVAWVPNLELSKTHELGFCPVIHWKRKRALHELYLDEIDALNRSLSQRHRASLYAGDPQLWETGVSTSEPSGPMGRTIGASIDPEKHYKPTYSTGPARKKGVSTVWSSANPDAKFGAITLPGDALKSIDDECARLRAMLMESFSYVDIDLSQSGLASDASGKALEILHRRQIDFDNKLRAEIERKLLRPMVEMAAAITGQTLDEIEIEWGLYFQPTPHDAQAAISAATAANDAGLCTKEQAIEYVAKFIGVRDPQETMEAIKQTPTPELALQLQQIGSMSPTFQKLLLTRLAFSVLGELDDATKLQIASEIENGSRTNSGQPADSAKTTASSAAGPDGPEAMRGVRREND